MPPLATRTGADLSGYSQVAPTPTAVSYVAPVAVSSQQNQQPGLNSYLRCPIPPVWNATPDSLRQFYQNSVVPQTRLFNPPTTPTVAPVTNVTNTTQVTNNPTVPLTITMNDVTASRAFNTIYTATDNLFIVVTGHLFLGVGHTGSMYSEINSVIGPYSTISNGSGFCNVPFMVPKGQTYEVVTGIIGPGDDDPLVLTNWIEWTLSS